MPKQRVGLRRELAGAPRTREGFSRTFLLRFICEKHTLSFRYAELDALLAAHGVDPKAAYAAPAGGAAGAGADPYVAVAFPSAACCQGDPRARRARGLGRGRRPRGVRGRGRRGAGRGRGAGQDKRAKFPTSKAPFSAVSHCFG